MIERLGCNPGKRQLSCAVKHSVIEAEDFEARRAGKYSKSVVEVADAFDQAHVWVYGDFTLTQPQRRRGFE
jgi:hypothetical protein